MASRPPADAPTPAINVAGENGVLSAQINTSDLGCGSKQQMLARLLLTQNFFVNLNAAKVDGFGQCPRMWL